MGKLHSYGKIWNLGHRAVRDIFSEPVRIQEKIDGSQFSFGVCDGELFIRSKKAEIHPGAKNGQFSMAVETVVALFEKGLLVEGWTYRGEAVTKPRHNHLIYERCAEGGIVLFDVDIGEEDYVDHAAVTHIARGIGVDVVPEYEKSWKVIDIENLNVLLDNEPLLGGENGIEGIVIKPCQPIFDQATGKALKAKLVRPEFREKATRSWKAANPNREEFLTSIIKGLTTEARFRKAIQAARDEDVLEYSNRDIGPLLGRITKDIHEEEADAIKEALFKHFWKKSISRGVTRGFPQFYQAWLLEQQFNEEEEDV